MVDKKVSKTTFREGSMTLFEKRMIRRLISKGILRTPSILPGFSFCVDFIAWGNPSFGVWLEGRHDDVRLYEFWGLKKLFDLLGIHGLSVATDYFIEVFHEDMHKKVRKIEKIMAQYREVT